MADRTAGEDGDIGGTRANVHQRHAQLLLVLRQHRQAGGQRVQHQLVHLQSAAAHAFDDVFSRALRAGHDVDLGLQPDTAHAYGFAHILAVNHEFLGFHQQQDVDGLGRLDDSRYIGLRDFLVLHRHHATGIDAANMAAGDAGVNPGDLAVSHQLGFLERLLNALHGGVNIDHDTALEPVAGRNAQARKLELTARHDFGNHGHDFAGSNVQPNHQIFVFFGHPFTFSLSCPLCHPCFPW